MCQNKLTEAMFRELDEFIAQQENPQAELIGILHKAQEIFGYLPREVQMYISRKIKLPASRVYGVVSFYSFFNEEPRGEHVISVCMGTACFVRGAEKILRGLEDSLKIKSGQTSADGKFTLDALRCVGACGLAPVVIVDGKVHGRVTEEQVDALIQSVQEKAKV